MRKRSLSVHAYYNVAENETNAAMRSRTIDRYHGTVPLSKSELDELDRSATTAHTNALFLLTFFPYTTMNVFLILMRPVRQVLWVL